MEQLCATASFQSGDIIKNVPYTIYGNVYDEVLYFEAVEFTEFTGNNSNK